MIIHAYALGVQELLHGLLQVQAAVVVVVVAWSIAHVAAFLQHTCRHDIHLQREGTASLRRRLHQHAPVQALREAVWDDGVPFADDVLTEG